MAPSSTRSPSRWRIAWGAALLACLAATWRLWTPLSELPRVAPGSLAAGAPAAFDFPLLLIVVFGVVASLATSSPRAAQRRTAIATVALSALMAVDQLRWQPWAYHALLTGALLSIGDTARTTRWGRLLAVSVYAWSALAKLDVEFADTLGTQMASVLVEPLGIDLAGWPSAMRRAAALALPAGELTLAAALALSMVTPRLAKAGVVLGVLMHAATIVVLGPWGLAHSLGVLVWNVGFAWQTWALFWPRSGESEPVAVEGVPSITERLVIALVALALVAPIGFYARCWDTWPSWGLYAPRAERAAVLVHESVFDRLPRSLRDVSTAAPVDGPWRGVGVDRWGLAENLAPLYPQNRVKLALAAALAERFPLGDRVRVVIEGPTKRWDRVRDERVIDGASACRLAASGWGVPAVAVWRR